jgi:ribonuclease Z
LIIHKIQKYNIPFQFFEGIKNGKDYILENLDIISNEELTEEPATPVSYAYCSDTLYEPDLKNEVLGVNLLYHEATFMHDLLDRAEATYHSTALQASQLAKDAEVGQLLIGHLSARYKDLAPLLQEAKTIFPQTELALEGRKFKIESK